MASVAYPLPHAFDRSEYPISSLRIFSFSRMSSVMVRLSANGGPYSEHFPTPTRPMKRSGSRSWRCDSLESVGERK